MTYCKGVWRKSKSAENNKHQIKANTEWNNYFERMPERNPLLHNLPHALSPETIYYSSSLRLFHLRNYPYMQQKRWGRGVRRIVVKDDTKHFPVIDELPQHGRD